jgi:prophage regulatory protein
VARSNSNNGHPTDPADGIVRILRRPVVEDCVGLSRSQIYSLIQQGLFPKPVPLGVNSVGWIEAEVAAWIAARIALRDQPPKLCRQQPPPAIPERIPVDQRPAIRRGRRPPRQHIEAAE